MKKKQEQIPLKIILQNFLNHIEHLETQGIEDIYEKNFQELKLLSEKLKSLKECSCSEGENEVNRKKNRYKDILPFDSSRVKLSEYVGVPGSNYINANFIRGASGSPAYIASQGPLPHTVNDFWRMVVEWDVQVIVMACSVEEAGKHKCEKYWVDHENEEKEFGNVKIRLVKASVICPDYLVRTMLIKYKSLNNNEIEVERKVCQYHYVAWPDHGVPSKVRPLVDMVRKVRETQVSETVPVLVHCSAGCGRTGTICAIDYVWGLLRSGKLSKDFSLFKLVQSMRKQRIAMVQTKEQYILVHQAVRELFNDQLRVIESHPYENIDINGMPLVKAGELAHASISSENTVEGWTSSKKSLPETLPHSSKMNPPMQQYRHSKGNFPISKSKSMNIHQCSKTDVAQIDVGASYLPATTFAQQQNPTDEVVSYGLVAGVKFRRGSQDDIALSPSSPPRVRRHASIILLRHSLIETTEGDVAPLSVWGSTQDPPFAAQRYTA
uniref:protein-tyrosine-phosphatase n=1 Tax=Timema californicum TaxID=61474 RepID=A0A7R9PB71_TIMCA|nr:unnamed protein product [Timema californicum]